MLIDKDSNNVPRGWNTFNLLLAVTSKARNPARKREQHVVMCFSRGSYGYI